MQEKWFSWTELKSQYPVIKQWIICNTVGKMPQSHVENTLKSISNINKHWDNQIVEKKIETLDDFYHPKFKVVKK